MRTIDTPKLVLLAFMLFCATRMYAVYNDSVRRASPLALEVELSSKYVLKGVEYGSGPMILPRIAFEKRGWGVALLGMYALNDSYKEVDVSVSYTYKGLTFYVGDYYCPSDTGEKDDYFNWSAHSTQHAIETYLKYDQDQFPVWGRFHTYIFGADRRPDGQQAYSTYAEVGYKHQLTSKDRLSAFVGATLNKSSYVHYEKHFAFCNLGVRYDTTIRLGNFHLPVSSAYVFNPYLNKSHITFSLFLSNKM